MLKLWGRPTSGRTQKVLWTLAEIRLEFELILASAEMGPGGHVAKGNKPYGVVDTPEYRAKNPNGRVPTIDDDGFVLWESNSIVRYLASRYGAGGLWPSEPRSRADSERWMDWQLSILIHAVNPVFLHLIRTPLAERDLVAIEQG